MTFQMDSCLPKGVFRRFRVSMHYPGGLGLGSLGSDREVIGKPPILLRVWSVFDQIPFTYPWSGLKHVIYVMLTPSNNMNQHQTHGTPNNKQGFMNRRVNITI